MVTRIRWAALGGLLLCLSLGLGMAHAQGGAGREPITYANAEQLAAWGEPVQAKNSPGGVFTTLAFAPEGSTLVAVYVYSDDTSFFSLPTVWPDAADLTTFQELETQDQDQIMALAFNPADPSLVTGSITGTVKAWDLDTGTSTPVFKTTASDGEGYACRLNGVVLGLAYSPDGEALAVGELGGTLTLLPAATEFDPSVSGGTCASTAGAIYDLAWAADGASFLVVRGQGSEPGWIDQWDAETLEVTRTFDQFNSIDAVSLSPDGVTAAVVDSVQDAAETWHYATHLLYLPTGEILLLDEETSRGMAFNSDGSLLAYGAGPVIQVFDVEAGEVLTTLRGHEFPVDALAFSPDDTLLVSLDASTIRAWAVPQ